MIDLPKQETKEQRLIREITGLSLQELELLAILSALKSTKGNKTHAAASLGLSRRGLHGKMKNHGLGREMFL